MHRPRVGWGEGVLAWGTRKSTSLKGQVQTLGACKIPGSRRSEVGVRGGCQVVVGPNQNWVDQVPPEKTMAKPKAWRSEASGGLGVWRCGAWE